MGHGTFPCGIHNDLAIYKEALKKKILITKFFMADEGYRDITTDVGEEADG